MLSKLAKTNKILILSIICSIFISTKNCFAEESAKIILVEKKSEARNWEKGRKYALIIGISDYLISNIPKLKYAANDAIEVKNFFSDKSFIKYDEVVLLLNEQADRKNILQKLNDIANKIGNQDTLFIYYSGHGKEDFLIPYDGDINYLKATCIRWKQDIFNEINTLDAKQKILIIDSCHSGTITSESPIAMGKGDSKEISIDDKLLEQMGQGLFIITSSRESEISWENDSIKHGYFTYYLVEGLKGYADKTGEQSFGNGDGYVTADELYNFVSYKTNDAVLKDLKKTQHPRKSFYGEGVIYLSKNIEGINKNTETAYITINTIPWSYIYIDGTNYFGETPVRAEKINLGEHTIEILPKNKKYKPVKQKINISSEKDNFFSWELEKLN